MHEILLGKKIKIGFSEQKFWNVWNIFWKKIFQDNFFGINFSKRM